MRYIIFTYTLTIIFFYSISTSNASESVRRKEAIEVSSSNGQVEIIAYPNPFKEVVNLDIIAHSANPTLLKIYDIIGVEKYSFDLGEFGSSGVYKIQIKDLPQGIYLCNVYSNNKLLETKKIISLK